MAMAIKGAEIDRSALIIVDMQNDFLHRDGSFGHVAREHPEFNIDIPFLTGTIPNVKKAGGCIPGSGKTGRVSCARAEARLFRRSLSPIGVSELSLRAATARIVWRARGERRSSMS